MIPISWGRGVVIHSYVLRKLRKKSFSHLCPQFTTLLYMPTSDSPDPDRQVRHFIILILRVEKQLSRRFSKIPKPPEQNISYRTKLIYHPKAN